jgi:hypothetical protein
MKKLFLVVAAGFLLVTSCNKTSSPAENTAKTDEPAMPEGRKCAAYDVLEEQLRQDPSLAQRMNDIEAFTRRFSENTEANKLLADGSMEVPVVVNVLYRTAAENISDAQIKSQIDVLNEDYGGSNSDVNKTNTYQSVKAGDTKIHFVLSNTVRKSTTTTSWGTNDAMKKSAQGGINPTSPSTTLNIWVCTLGGGVLGYAQFPGGNSATDGVVILNTALGRTGTAAAPYGLGRTATHEVGHYFNLRHIWGDRRCGDDLVADTPAHDAANFGCPAANKASKCSGHPIEMTMNYMDYTDDACMYMFSAGQKTRMNATYAVGGPRASLRP